jgi:Fe-S cluster assembly protein SufD
MTEIHRPKGPEALAPAGRFGASGTDSTSSHWLAQAQRRAEERFAALGLPTTQLEEWRHASLLPVAAMLTDPPAPTRSSPTRAALDAQFGAGPRLVFDHGQYAPELSSPGPDGVVLSPLAAAIPTLEGLLASIAERAPDGVALLNAARFRDGAFVRVARGRAVEAPIHLVFVGPATVRSLIDLSGASSAEIVETHLLPEGSSLGIAGNAYTGIVLGMGASLRYARLFMGAGAAVSLSKVEVLHGRDSRFFGTLASIGGRLARTELRARLESGAEHDLAAVYQVSGQETADVLTHLEHAGSHGVSRQVVKGVIDDQATGTFYGKVRVEAGTAKNDARQSSRSLLLSGKATANTRPQLEIDSEDVACSHGATIGRLDEEQVFYLVSRGISEPEARRILVRAFAGDIVDRLADAEVRRLFAEALGAEGGRR